MSRLSKNKSGLESGDYLDRLVRKVFEVVSKGLYHFLLWKTRRRLLRMKTMESGLIEATIKEYGVTFYTYTRNDAIAIAWRMAKGDLIDVPYNNKNAQNLLQSQA
jgi:hypothetical protein